MKFEEWLTEMYKKANGSPLSSKSIEHYTSALKIISEDMYCHKKIHDKLENMDLLSLDYAIAVIMSDDEFIIKDKKGNKMYSNALKRYRCYVYYQTDLGKKEIEEIDLLEKDDSLSMTEREILIKARKGQGIFRDQLRKKYDNKCIVTGIDIPQVLVASHIKPWAISNNEERLSVDNGLLLSATYDRLFDSGLISFKKDGTILISSIISKENIASLHLKKSEVFDIKYNPKMDKFLDYHNNVIYVK